MIEVTTLFSIPVLGKLLLLYFSTLLNCFASGFVLEFSAFLDTRNVIFVVMFN